MDAAAAALQQLTLPAVLVTALIDSINPCAIGVLVFLITTLVSLSARPRRMLFAGAVYIIAVYVTYFLAGVGLLYSFQKLNIAEPVGIFVGFLVIVLGLIEVKDFFWEGFGFSLEIPSSAISHIKTWAKKGTIPSLIVLGFLVAAVELPCTGGPYLAITTYLANVMKATVFDFGKFLTAVYYLLIYNFIFVLPLIVIVGAAYVGLNMEKVSHWKKRTKKWMRLATGLLMIGLGVLLILYARGDIAIGA